MEIDREDYLNELRDNIKSRDVIKARIILDHVAQMDEDVQVRVLFELSRAEDDFAIPLLARMLQMADQMQIPAEQIRKVVDKKIEEFPFALLSVIQDDAIIDKREYIRMAGEVQSNESVPVILNLLSKSDDMEFNEICIEALGKIGNPKVINDVSDYLYSGKRQLTITAINALSNMATPEAIERLAERMGTDAEFDRMILEAFARVRDHKSLQMLNKMLLSHNAYQRNFCIDKLTQIGSKAIPVVVENLSSKNSDLLIHTLNILGNIGDLEAAQPIRKLLFNEPKDANVRFAAYEALGKLPLQKGSYVLTAGLSDPEKQVHIAAARALERNLDPTVIAGIKNLLRGSDAECYDIVVAFIDAEAENTFNALIKHDVFRDQAMDYLQHEAHPDIKDFYIKILIKLGENTLVEKLGAKVTTAVKTEKPLVYAVDDSRMILKIYKSTLHTLEYPAELFEFPETALQQIKERKPGLVITDLNMPVMNGVQLTKEIRKLYDKETLPILMVTTQQDLQDREAAFNAGINGIVYKPFTKESLAAEMEKLI